MEYTGFIRKLDSFGRITLPVELKARKESQIFRSYIKNDILHIEHAKEGRKLDELGRYTIPKEARKYLGFKNREPLKIIEVSDKCLAFVPENEKLTICMRDLDEKDREAIEKILKLR